jgi:hypothetical protein
MPVNTPCAEYEYWRERWRTVRTVVEGEDAIKKSGEWALPRPSGQLDEDYKEYLERARFFDVVSRTADTFHGLIFNKEPTQRNIIPEIEEAQKNVDGAGRSLRKFADDVIYDVVQTYWGGILVDYPRVDLGETQAEAPRNAYSAWYTAESLINWSDEIRRGKKVTTLVVLREDEKRRKSDDYFVVETVERYRVLLLDERDVYIQKIYVRGTGGKLELSEIIEPILDEKPLDFIPFWFCPFDEPTKSILLGMSYEAIGMFQDMADYKNSLHYTCSPTFVVENMEPPPIDKATGKPKNIRLGSKEMQFFYQDSPQGGSSVNVKCLAYEGRGLQEVAGSIDAALYRIALLGARALGADKKGIESAETVRLYRSSENGVLVALAMAMSVQFTESEKHRMRWSGISEDVYKDWSYNFNTDYDVMDANTEMINTIITARGSGDVPRYAAYSVLREAKRIPPEWSYEDYLKELSVADIEKAKRLMLAEIAEGVASKYEYRMKFFGESEEIAKANVAAPIVDYELIE